MKKAGDLLNSFFDEVQREKGERYVAFYESWQKIAGEKIGRNSRIVDLEGAVLIVEVDHPGWIQLLQINEKKILYKVRKLYPELGVEKLKIFLKGEMKERIAPEKSEINQDSADSSVETMEESPFKDLLQKMKKRSKE